MNSLIPAARASSMAYWIRGRSTSVMISFGTDLVAGRNRVPRPATGKTAFVTFRPMLASHLFMPKWAISRRMDKNMANS